MKISLVGWRTLLPFAVMLLNLPIGASARPAAGPPRLTAFYVPWDPASAAALTAHQDAIDTLVPVWASVGGPDHVLTVNPDVAGHTAIAALRHRPRLLIAVQNFAYGDWDGKDTDALLADPAASAALIDALAIVVKRDNAAGVMIDFEHLSEHAQPNLVHFAKNARRKLGRIEIAVPVGNAGWDLKGLADVADQIIPMIYDQHWSTGEPGPIAGVDWYEKMMRQVLETVPAKKISAGIAGYAYDWPQTGTARTLSVTQAVAIASAKGATVEVDPASDNAHFSYAGEDGAHQVWSVPADAMRAEIRKASALGIGTVALWRLGTEDPDFWAMAGANAASDR